MRHSETKLTFRRPFGLGAAAMLMAVTAGVLSAPVQAAATCTYDKSTHTATASVSGDPVNAGPGHNIYVSGGTLFIDGNECTGGGKTATVTNTDTFVVNGTPEANIVALSLSNEYGPGFSPENSPEIEFEFYLGKGYDYLIIYGTGGSDLLRFGSKGINLNPDEPAGVDADVVSLNGVNLVEATGQAGADVFSGIGGRGTGGHFQRALRLVGGAAGDRLIGGDASDSITNSQGITSDNDADVLKGMGEADNLDSVDGDGLDTLDGGDGADTCHKDAGDERQSCQVVS